MENQTILIHGGVVVSESGMQNADLLIEGQTVKAQALPGTFAASQADVAIDAQGKYVLPGLIDPHVHFNSPFMGSKTIHDYDNGTIAAAFGGVTTIIDFSTQPKGGSILENLAQKEEEARGKAYVDWSMHGIILDTDERALAEIPLLIEKGVPTYKCFSTYRQANRMTDDEGMLKVLEATARYGGMMMVHCENDTILEYHLQKELAAGHFAAIYHARSRPPSAENEAIRRVIALMREVTAPVYIAHTSTAESVEIIQQARQEGLPLHSETCTHYLTLSEEALNRENGVYYICSPPLRKPHDMQQLWQAAADGRVEVVSTDDAGMPSEERVRLGSGRFDKITNGMPGIEPRLAILYTEGVYKGRISLPRLVALTSSNPARLFGMYPRKGHLSPGADADVVIYNPQGEWTMSAANLHMNDVFCPFEGWQIQGRVETVLSRGQFVVRDGALSGKAGHGQRVMRKLPQGSA